MIKKVANRLDEQDPTLEVAALPVTESESESESETVTETQAILDDDTVAIPVVEPEAEAPSDEGTLDRQAIKILELKIAELEDKFTKLQTELNSFRDNKSRKKKKIKENKEKKVKCKCKDKKVELAKCKCRTKKLAKLNK